MANPNNTTTEQEKDQKTEQGKEQEKELKTEQEKESTGNEKTGNEKTENEKTGNEKAENEKTGNEKTGNEEAENERTGNERLNAGHEKIKTYEEKTFEHGLYTEEQLAAAKAQQNKHERKSKMKNVVEVIKELREPEDKTFEFIDQVRTSSEPSMHQAKLHYSRGTMLTDKEGKNVLEFDVAGSGFRVFRADYKGMKVNKGDKISFWQRLARFGRYVKSLFSSTPSDYAEMTERDKKLEKVYGENYQVVNETGKRLKHVRSRTKVKEIVREDGKKEVIRKQRITMAGPLAMLGLNRGDYSIHNLRKYIKYMGSQYLTQVFEEAKARGERPKDVHIMLKGHSRGAVATLEGAMMLKHWVEHHPEYKKYADCVKFEITQYDPVAGWGSNHGLNEEINHMSTEQNLQQSGDQMSPLGNSAETTVMYSIHSNNKIGFTPQLVKGAKRVILTPYDHSQGLRGNNKDKGDPERTGPEEAVTGVKDTYTDIQTKEVYRSSAINELPEGVFVMDHQRNLIRVNSPEEAEKIVDTIMGKNTSQADRHKIVKEAAKSWFEYHGKAAEAKKVGAETVKEESAKEESTKEESTKEVIGEENKKEAVEEGKKESTKEAKKEAVEEGKEVTSEEIKKESSETTEKTEQEKESEKEIDVPELDGFFR